jgi:signal transduction histidine kinase
MALQLCIVDITDRKRMEEEMKASHRQLRALAVRLQRIREEERILVARELHDEMGGGLTGLKMDFSWLSRNLAGAVPDVARAILTERILTSKASIDGMVQVVRRICTDLRPSCLDDLGLIAALSWQAQEFAKRTGIRCAFSSSLDYCGLEDETATGVFRVFQEALTNVARHSRATEVDVVFRKGGETLGGEECFVLAIRDNGRGITEEEILNPGSLGLLGMKERVLAFRGELAIRGDPAGGTALVLRIPEAGWNGPRPDDAPVMPLPEV